MATIRIVLGIFCLAFSRELIEPGSDILRFEMESKVKHKVIDSPFDQGLGFPREQFIFQNNNRLADNRKLELFYKYGQNHKAIPFGEGLAGDRILNIARSQLNVREATGKNDGIAVEQYLKYTGNKKGEPWCASFVSWVYGQAGFLKPRTAWSPALFPSLRQTNDPLPAAVFGIYFPKLNRIAHCGLVELRKGNWIYTIEGNTNLVGSRDGDGVYRKLRHTKTIKIYADWFPINKKGDGS